MESEGIITSWNAARGFDMESYKASIEEDVVTEDCDCNEESCVDDDVDEEQEDDEVEDQDCCDDDEDYVADEEEEEDEEEEDDVSEVEKLSERVWSLETAVTDIKDMVQHLFNNLVSSNQKKRKPLRKPVVEQN